MVDAARCGSREAFDRLIADHESEIRKFLAKRIAKEHVDDLLQDIWLAAWTSLGDFDSRSQFRTWLYGITINKCKSHYRSLQRKVSLVSLDDRTREPAGEVRVMSEVEALLPSLIEQLSDTHRQLLDLYYYGELTLPEISRLLERNLNTVKYQFYRAHSELAARLTPGEGK